jgi:NTP pyrophosphatase (non-canonical NTP hydrolase)
MKTYYELEADVIDWANARQIIPNSTPAAQATKTLEEVRELIDAIDQDNRAEMIDAYGDILVTLIIGSRIAGFDLTDCLGQAYNCIKDRTGYLNVEGVFVKNT